MKHLSSSLFFFFFARPFVSFIQLYIMHIQCGILMLVSTRLNECCECESLERCVLMSDDVVLPTQTSASWRAWKITRLLRCTHSSSSSPSCALSDPLPHRVHCHIIYRRIHNDFALDKQPTPPICLQKASADVTLTRLRME